MQDLMSQVSKEYKNMVDLEKKLCKGIVLFNSSMPHAAYIIKSLLEVAEKEVRVFSGTFFELFYDNFKETIEETLNRVNFFRVITIYEKSQEIGEMLKGKYDNFDYVSLNISMNKEEVHQIQHFSVYDDSKWRIEEEHQPNLDADSIVKAEACFNNQETGKRLKQTFDKIWENVLERKRKSV